jgi:hypothetical protein
MGGVHILLILKHIQLNIKHLYSFGGVYIAMIICQLKFVSKNEQIHDNVIGMYIERFYYKTGTYGNNSS